MRPVSNNFIKIANQKGKFTLRDDMLNNNVSVYTAPNYGTGGSGKLNDFVTKLNTSEGTFNILLEPDVENPNINGNIINRGRAPINNDISISTNSLLSDTKSFLVNTDLSNNEKVLFFAFKPIEDDNNNIDKDARVYMMTNFEKYTNMDGSFSQGLMTLARVHSFNLINPLGNAINIEFTTKGIQPLNVKRIVLKFESFYAMSEVSVINSLNIKENLFLSNSGTFKPNYMYPQVVSEGGNVVWECPWVGQYKYIKEWMVQENNVVKDEKFNKVLNFSSTTQSSGIDYFYYGNSQNSGNLKNLNIKVRNLIPSTRYNIRLNRNGWGLNYDKYQDWYIGSGSYEDDVKRNNIQDTDLLANISNGSGISLFDINSRELDGDYRFANEPMLDKSPWDDWSGFYRIDVGHLFYRNKNLLSNDYFFISEPSVKEFSYEYKNKLNNDIINGDAPTFNGVSFESQIPSPITQIDRDPAPKNWSPVNDNEYLLLIPIQDNDFIPHLLNLMENSSGNNSSDQWNYVTKKMFLKHDGDQVIDFKVPQGDSPAMNHNRIPQNAFLSSAYANQNGWPTANHTSMVLDLNQETKLNSVSISAYGGEYVTISFRDANNNNAKAEHKDKDGNIVIEEIKPKQYKLIQLTNRLLTKTSITFGA